MSASGGNGAHEPIDAEALDWALRMAEPTADWDEFLAWLEADPRRSTRYDHAVCSLEAATELVRRQAPTPATAYETSSSRPARRHWIGGAMAAALIGVIGLGVWQERDRSYMVATTAGEQRVIRLADGSNIVMAGGSRVQLDPGHPRSATLLAGQALFRVRHDAADPFRVRAGDLDLTDLGTVFDVRLLGDQTHVVVAEGAVLVDPQGARLRLEPGQSVTDVDGQLRRGRQDATEVGAWREGHLAYDDAALRDVAADLSRQLGLRITTTPAVAARTFNGTLEMRGLRDDPGALGVLLDVEVRRNGSDWILDERR